MRQALSILICALMLCQSASPGIIVRRRGVAAASGPVVYTQVQRCSAVSNAVACTVTAGNLVVVHTLFYNSSAPTCSTSDGGVTLTNTTNSPTFISGGTTHNGICISYILSTSGGAKTYTTTLGGSGINNYVIFVEEYSYTGGSSAYDKDAGNQSTSASTPIVLPSVTPTLTGSLLTASGFAGNSIIGIGGSWTAAGSTVGGTQQAYILASSAGATTVNFTDAANPDSQVAMVAVFK